MKIIKTRTELGIKIERKHAWWDSHRQYIFARVIWINNDNNSIENQNKLSENCVHAAHENVI